MEDSQTYNFTVNSSIKNYDVIFESIVNLKNRMNKGDIIISSEFIHRNIINNIDNKFIYVVDDKETTKEYSFANKLIIHLIDIGFKRNNKLIAIGGGVVQDLTGFVASMLYRGVEWNFYPTTLLSQGDSCIGSKTSINVGEYKNVVGNFYPPSKVIIDTQLLSSLPESQIKSGIGEMSHYFFIDGRKSFEYFKNNFKNPYYSEMIYRSLMIKKKMIEIDEFDQKERKVFNYGHTFGHAIESITNYNIPHGVSVSYGMMISNFVSYKLGYINKGEMEEMNEVLYQINGKNLPEFDFDYYISLLKKDKKNIGHNLGLVLTKGIGEMFLKQIDPNEDIISYIKEGLDICKK